MSVATSLPQYLLTPPGVTARVGAVSTVEAEYCFEPSFPGFEGHFPAKPIVPGIAQIMAVVHTVCHDRAGQLKNIKRCKFTRPVRPMEHLKILAEVTDNGTERHCKATLWADGEPSANISIIITMQQV